MNFTGLSSPLIRQKELEESSVKSKLVALHKKAARHLKEAARLHLEAIAYYEKKETERARRSALKAHDHVALAIEAQKKDQRPNAAW